MNTQIKQIFYGILAIHLFFHSCTFLTLGPKEYQWPPKDGKPFITLLGPVYEAGSETKAPLFLELEQAITAIVKNQQTHLPEFYQQRISGMKHLLFRMGYSNDEEWGYIKTVRQAGTYDPVRVASVLETSESRQPGLELAVRMQPVSEPNPTIVTLEGYRLILQSNHKGQVEWFTQEVKLTGRKAGEDFQKALVWLLAKPFAQAQKSFVLENVEVPIWKDKNIGGLLKFTSKEFTADSEPIRKKILETCVQTGHCPVHPIKVEGDEFALVSNFADAQTICQMFKRVVIDKDTLLRLSLIQESANMLDEENGAAWHSSEETGYFKGHSGHQEFLQAKKGVVWCKLAKPETLPTFVQGTYIWSDGSKYEGAFKDGKPSGQGTLTSPGWYNYVGQWKNDKFHGHGTLTWSNGDKYEGEWKDGRRNGQGILSYSVPCCGQKYRGEWKNGKFHGQGAFTWSDGYSRSFRLRQGRRGYVLRVDKGEFKDGKFICEQLQNDSIEMGWCKSFWLNTYHFLNWDKQKEEITLSELSINFPVIGRGAESGEPHHDSWD